MSSYYIKSETQKAEKTSKLGIKEFVALKMIYAFYLFFTVH